MEDHWQAAQPHDSTGAKENRPGQGALLCTDKKQKRNNQTPQVAGL